MKEGKKVTKKVNLKKEIISWLLVIAGGFLFAMFVTRVVIVKAEIPSGSMIDTINEGDKVIGNRLAYLFSSPDRGDIVIFEWPDDPSQNYVKRVIGLPGETVSFADNKVFIDGIPLEEEYTDGKPTVPDGDKTEFKVPEGHYFMLGDNRTISLDSRFWENPFVAKAAIKGKVWIRYSPSWSFIN